ncbi:hypothetical protein SADUNF_Sadunf02G0120000 [Salix dunnii]|uniref:Uncharacterized protein n=1 Tax=Salix dunnii TaxID=1413687 RepID=A0A835N7F4_9ROSI|nr:hypothetical protein SADUNF_Sadunf02G0120000 [Salix dunnii]
MDSRCCGDESFVIEKIHIDNNVSNMMTKPLPREKFEFCRREVDLVEPPKLKLTNSKISDLPPIMPVVDTVKAVKMTNVRGEVRYPIKVSSYCSLTCLNSIFDTGQSALLIDGCNVLIACLDFNLQKTKMQLGVQVLVNDPRELEKILFTTKRIDAMSLRARAVAARRVRKEDMRHVAKVRVAEERIAAADEIMIRGTETTSLLDSPRCKRLYICLMRWTGRCMMPYLLFRGPLNLIRCLLSMLPRIAELVAKLLAYHYTAQTKADKKQLSSMGLDLSKGTVRNNLEAGVIEPAMSKVKIIQFATEAAITILRIDDMIKLVKDESGPQAPPPV